MNNHLNGRVDVGWSTLRREDEDSNVLSVKIVRADKKKNENEKIDEHPTKESDIKAVLTGGRAGIWLRPAWIAKTGRTTLGALLEVTRYFKVTW